MTQHSMGMLDTGSLHTLFWVSEQTHSKAAEL